jgi:N-acetylglucosamine kinase-like BadF-type ATPase
VYVGIDGGGTKTEFVAVSPSGSVVKRIIKQGCNPNDIGFSVTEDIIVSGINEILKDHPSIRGIFAGIAGTTTGGYGERLYRSLSKLYPRTSIEVKSDAFNIFALHDGADMALISGTGSVLFVKLGEGYSRLGGWGYLFDNAGSAYDIGRAAVRHALKCEERREKPTNLYKTVLKKM